MLGQLPLPTLLVTHAFEDATALATRVGVIDGGRRGNDARWINHACSPNCEAYEEEGRVFIHALRPIARGESSRIATEAIVNRTARKSRTGTRSRSAKIRSLAPIAFM